MSKQNIASDILQRNLLNKERNLIAKHIICRIGL